MRTIYLLPLLLISYFGSAQCTFSLGADVTYCQGQTISNVFSAPAGQSSYLWSTGATTQNITATAAGAYTCTVTLLSANLVTNGNFTSGNTGFSSSYSVGAGGSWGPVSNPGTYYIANNANTAHTNFSSFAGHGGSGNMMICNGSDIAGTSVWCKSIAVTANTNYNFSAWAATCVNGSAAELADLQFSINGSLIGSQYSPSMSPGVWTQFNATWNSGASTTANICIVNQNTTASGNDFALDDIFFQQSCTANDAVSIIVNPKPTVTVPTNTTVCNGATIAATAFVSTPVGATYTWTNNNTTIGLAASGSGNVPSFTATNAGSSVISGVISVIPTLNGCVGNATNYTITVNPTPVLTAVTSQTICANNSTSAINFASTPAGASVNWTNTNSTIGLAASGSGNIASFVGQNSGATTLTGSISATPTLNTCIGSPINFTIVVNPIPTLSAVTSQTVCAGTATSAITYVTNPAGTPSVNWTNSNATIGLAASGTGNISSFTASNSTSSSVNATLIATPVLGTCVGSPQTFTITVDPTPTLSAVTSQTICVGNNTAAVNFTSTPAGAILNWTNTDPTIGLAASGSGNIASFVGQNSGASALTGSISVTPTLNSCIGSPINFNIVVSPGPTLSAVSSQTVCAGTGTTAITYVTTPPGITTVNWTNSNTTIGLSVSGAGDISSFTASNGTAATISSTLVATPSIGTCIGAPQTFTITVDPSPVLSSVTSQTICVNNNTSTINFSSNPTGAIINWTNSNSSIGLAASGSGDILSFAGQNAGATALTGNIIATPTLNTCVGSPITFDIIVSPGPVLSTVSSQTVCTGASGTPIAFTTTPAGIATINWSNTDPTIGLAASGVGDITSFTANNPTASAINAVLNATPSIGTCVGNPQTFTITVSPSPTVTAISNITVCNTSTVNASAFSGTAGASFNWTNSNTSIGLATNGTGNYASFTAANISTSPSIATITITPILNSCIGTPTNYSITVNPTPAPPTTASVSPYCLNQGATPLSATPNTGGSLLWWGTSAAGGTSSGIATTPLTNTVGTAVYYVSQTISACESPRAPIQVTVNTLPSIVDPVDTVVCSGINVPIRNFVSTPAGATINWSNTNTAIGLAASGTGDVSSFSSVNSGSSPITGLVTVTPNIGTCFGTPITYSVTINPIPTAIVNNVTACNNASVSSINWTSNPTGASYTWTNTNSSIGIGSSGNSSINSFTAANSTSSATNATVSVTPTLNGCLGSPSAFTITVNPTPAAPNVANNTYCKNDVASTLSPSGAGYLWYTTLTGGTGTASAPTPSTAAAGTNSYYVSQTVNGCEGPRSTITITTKNLPSATLASVTTKCPPLCTKLALSSPDNLTSYNWVLGDGSTFSGNDTVTNHCYNLSGSYTISVTITDNNNCASTITFPNAVMVAEVPEADFTFDPQPTTLLDPTITFTNTSIGSRPLSFQWNFGVEPGTYYTSENTGHTYESAGSYQVQLVTTNGFGCSDTTYKTVIIGDDIAIYVPNTFTPNGDGVNESFFAQGIGIEEKDFSMMIFNRWGEKIFQSNSLNEAWNGKMNDKTLLDNETFIWKIIYKSGSGDRFVKSGHVTLVK